MPWKETLLHLCIFMCLSCGTLTRVYARARYDKRAQDLWGIITNNKREGGRQESGRRARARKSRRRSERHEGRRENASTSIRPSCAIYRWVCTLQLPCAVCEIQNGRPTGIWRKLLLRTPGLGCRRGNERVIGLVRQSRIPGSSRARADRRRNGGNDGVEVVRKNCARVVRGAVCRKSTSRTV